jgi:small neutral amino acid transporter SnatA (MarC family)
MSFGFLVAGFFATTNAGRVALARETEQPAWRTVAAALLAGASLVVLATLLADDLLGALTISPESFRIAAGFVLLVTAIRMLLWPAASTGPFGAVLVTPELAVIALSFGGDEPTGKVLGAAAITLPLLLIAAMTLPWLRGRLPLTSSATAQFLAALQIVVAVALAISGMRDV